MPSYMHKVLGNYLSERSVVVSYENEDEAIPVYAGVPQGSVLGPLLWNIVYDGVLQISGYSSTLIAFADDLLVITIGRDFDRLSNNIKLIHPLIHNWFIDKGLQLD